MDHELLDQIVKRFDPVLWGTAIEQPRTAGRPVGAIAQPAAAFILVLDQLPVAARGSELAGVLASRAWMDGAFSSAHTATRRVPAAAPPSGPSYRSRIQLAFWASLGSRAKIQER